MLEENDTLLRLFLNLQHQWIRDGKGKLVGMDYLALEAAARLSGIELDPGDFDCIQAMEREWLSTGEQSD